jgi:hypothetical protein
MKVLLLVICLFCYLLLGCYKPSTLHFHSSPSTRTPIKVIYVYVDKNFTPAEVREITQALDQWRSAMNGHLDFQITNVQFDMEDQGLRDSQAGKAWLILQIDSHNPVVQHQDHLQHVQTLAFVDRIGGSLIYVVKDRIGDRLRGVLLHEMGHLLGARHHYKTLMNPYYFNERSQCVDLETVQQVASYWHLDWQALNYCQFD